MTKNAMIEEIIASEWRMFDLVQNIGQRASCQDDYDTFRAMRLSQLETWTEDVLLTYWSDHQAANLRGINLIERKYAYMMRYTAPDYYSENLAPYLPKQSEEKGNAIDRIMTIYSAWYKVARVRWPNFVSRGRPADEEESCGGMTSVDVYMRGELLSYSIDTVKAFLNMAEEKSAAGENMVAAIYENTARLYGYDSLNDAEERLKNGSVGR